MKLKYYIVVFILFVGATNLLSAQDIEEIIAKHIDAHGGSEKWDKISSMAINAKFTAFSEENEFYAIKSNRGEYYSDLYIGKHKIKEAFNGEYGWTIDPWHEFLYPRLLNKAEVNAFHQKAEFFTPFYKYKENGFEVELLGEENVDGMDMYAIKLTRSSGMAETWYLDKNTFLEYKCISEWVDFAIGRTCETFFDDFQTVEGVLIPFFVERMFVQRDHVLLIEKVAFNTLDDYSIFEMPKSEEMHRFAFMVGDWDVKVEKMSPGSKLYTADETESSVIFRSANDMEQTVNVEDYYVQPMAINYSYHKSSKKYRLTVYNGFTSSLDVLEGDFVDSVFIADNTKIKFGEYEAPEGVVQLSLKDITEDNFVMEIKASKDKGENWSLVYKLTYSRKI